MNIKSFIEKGTATEPYGLASCSRWTNSGFCDEINNHQFHYSLTLSYDTIIKTDKLFNMCLILN